MHKTIEKCYISVNVQKADFDINSEIKAIKFNKIIGGIANFTGVVIIILINSFIKWRKHL